MHSAESPQLLNVLFQDYHFNNNTASTSFFYEEDAIPIPVGEEGDNLRGLNQPMSCDNGTEEIIESMKVKIVFYFPYSLSFTFV